MKACSCPICKGACESKSGWFLPSDIPKLAKHLGITEQELVRERLALDYYFHNKLTPDTWKLDEVRGIVQMIDHPIWVLAPPNVRTAPGTVYGANPTGACAFYQAGLCAIHAAKPHECRLMLHSDSKRRTSERKQAITRVWRKHQQWLFDLLGYVPDPPQWRIEDMEALRLMHQLEVR